MQAQRRGNEERSVSLRTKACGGHSTTVVVVGVIYSRGLSAYGKRDLLPSLPHTQTLNLSYPFTPIISLLPPSSLLCIPTDPLLSVYICGPYASLSLLSMAFLTGKEWRRLQGQALHVATLAGSPRATAMACFLKWLAVNLGPARHAHFLLLYPSRPLLVSLPALYPLYICKPQLSASLHSARAGLPELTHSQTHTQHTHIYWPTHPYTQTYTAATNIHFCPARNDT